MTTQNWSTYKWEVGCMPCTQVRHACTAKMLGFSLTLLYFITTVWFLHHIHYTLDKVRQITPINLAELWYCIIILRTKQSENCAKMWTLPIWEQILHWSSNIRLGPTWLYIRHLTYNGLCYPSYGDLITQAEEKIAEKLLVN